MREKQRPAPVRSERQLDALEAAPVEEITTHRPALVIGLGRNGMARRAGSQHIGDEAFVPSADLLVRAQIRSPDSSAR